MRRRHLLALALLGCGTTGLSSRGRQVSVLEADPGVACAAVGDVLGSADPFFGGLKPTEQLAEAARNDARNEAARAGATHVRFTGAPTEWPSGTFGGGRAVTVSAVAYRCPAPSARPEPSDAGCSKDTDCKGDRICVSRTCVEPARTH